MKKDLKKLLKDCKTIRQKLLLKQTNVFKSEYEKLVIRTQLNDINLFIKELEKIIKKGD